MPTLTWVGKEKVVNHHHEVPFRVLKKQYTFHAQHSTAQHSTAQLYLDTNLRYINNRIIHGDNLEALKSLLPEFEGKINCIYIDPPYNTGEEKWQYNDNVNDPKIKKWLGQVVGKEGEDLSRHDKWLCMIYPRIKLLHRLLANDGVFLLSIDDIELSNIKLVLDEIFGLGAFVSQNIVARSNNGNGSDLGYSGCHDYVLVYKKSAQSTPVFNGIFASEKYKSKFKYTDKHGIYKTDGIFRKKGGGSRREDSEGCFYPLYYNPSTLEVALTAHHGWHEVYPKLPNGADGRWIWSKAFAEGKEYRLIAGKKGKGTIYVKDYADTTIKEKPRSILAKTDYHTEKATEEIKSIFGVKEFATPKPVQLIIDLLDNCSPPNGIILDSFAGSGTTAHAVLKLNAQNPTISNRKFILIETESYAETITAERVRRVMNGYGQGVDAVAGLGGSFDYYTVGDPIFLHNNNLNEAVGIEVIRDYVAYTERIPETDRAQQENPYSPHLLGMNKDVVWLFNYEVDKATVLDMDYLASLKFGDKKPKNAIIYADRCLLEKSFMTKHGIIFKKIPRDITRF